MKFTEKDYEALINCLRCGFCIPSCPTYSATGTERASPRGRMFLLRAACEGRLPLSPNLVLQLYQCLDCRACLAACPGGVRTDQLFAKARSYLAKSELLPSPLRELDHKVNSEGNILGEANQNRLLWGQDRPSWSPGAGSPAEVLYFVGCVASLYPTSYGVPQALTTIMERAGINFALLGSEEWCCGYPLLEAGLPADELVQRNLARVRASGANRLVTSCPSCFYTWKELYPKTEVEVVHATQFLAELIAQKRIPLRELKKRVTYHDPCDLGRKGGIYDAPREVMNAIPGLELVEMTASRENLFCCGGGGNLESVDPGLSRTVAGLRLGQASSLGVEAIVSACQQCERTLNSAARRMKVPLNSLDIVQVVRMAMDSHRALGT